jgi:hypothetical protein
VPAVRAARGRIYLKVKLDVECMELKNMGIMMEMK